MRPGFWGRILCNLLIFKHAFAAWFAIGVSDADEVWHLYGKGRRNGVLERRRRPLCAPKIILAKLSPEKGNSAVLSLHFHLFLLI